jgi:hypothetical protein
MVISTYQLNTVLRVYGNQLRQGRISPHTSAGQAKSPDTVNITAGNRKDAVVDKVVSGMMEQIAGNGPRNPDETAAFDRLEKEFGQPLILSRKNGNQYVFKAVSDKDNTAIDIPAETSDHLVSRLNNHLIQIVSQNMIA